jgi:site-specific DNA recombinase
MDKLYHLYQDDSITQQGFKDRYRPLEERLEQLSDEIPRQQGALDAARIHRESTETLIDDAHTLYSHWTDLSYTEKRHVVEAIVTTITIGLQEISFDLAYLPTPQTATKENRNLRDSSQQPE